MSEPQVTILGCGPAGLLAAHAVEQLGGSVRICSRPIKSDLPGAQYLHESVPGLDDDRWATIETVRTGSARDYAIKVYGDENQPVSWGEQAPTRLAWDLRATYDALWETYADRIEPMEVTPGALWWLSRRSLVLNSTPAIHLCNAKTGQVFRDHVFKQTFTDVLIGYSPIEQDNRVEYDSRPEVPWYRTARIFGHASTELPRTMAAASVVGYAEHGAEEGEDVRVMVPKKAIKVVGTTCNCWPEVKRIGRFGTWSKSYLTHHAYHDAIRYYKEVFS